MSHVESVVQFFTWGFRTRNAVNKLILYSVNIGIATKCAFFVDTVF
jgi:hypothetical protein